MNTNDPTQKAPRLLAAARDHGDPADVELWPVPVDDPDVDDRGHGDAPPVAERQSQIRGLFAATYQSTIATKNYSSRGGQKIRVAILHTGETGDANGDNGSAKNLSEWFARPEAESSAHACGDADRLIRNVPCVYAAWTCRGANKHAVQLELATRAKRTRAQWLADPGMLEIAAQWLAGETEEHGLPLVLLTPAQYRAGAAGVMDHFTYTQATGDGTHWDVGTSFPWDVVLPRAQALRYGTTPTTPTRDWFDDMDEKTFRSILAPLVADVAEIKLRIRGADTGAGGGHESFDVLQGIERKIDDLTKPIVDTHLRIRGADTGPGGRYEKSDVLQQIDAAVNR